MIPTTRSIELNFPDWTTGQCRAYRAGVMAGLRGKPIREGYEYDAADEDEDLTLHFFRGYADAVGEDATGEEWFEEIAEWKIVTCWWED